MVGLVGWWLGGGGGWFGGCVGSRGLGFWGGRVGGFGGLGRAGGLLVFGGPGFLKSNPPNPPCQGGFDLGPLSGSGAF